jgi:hypothetical protein
MLDSDIRTLLATPELKLVFEAEDEQYRLEYDTQILAVGAPEDTPKVRVYQLVDQVRGGVMGSPWGEFDLDKQSELVANAIRFSRYRLTAVTEGWTATCSTCGFRFSGEAWRTRPRVCANPDTRGKGHPMPAAEVKDRPLTSERAASLGVSAALVSLRMSYTPRNANRQELNL